MADPDAEFDPEDPTAPVGWDLLLSTVGRTETAAVAVVERHSETLAAMDSMADAVAHCYERIHEDYDEADRPPDQGAAFLFAYLLEREGIQPAATGSPDGVPSLPSLVDRRPTDAALERLVWDEEAVPWWIAVRLGVHYSLVQFWCYEADVPLMVRNVWHSRHEIAAGADGGQGSTGR